jgi:hypothetical protein
LLKTAMAGLICPVTARKILPRRTRAQNPKHTIQGFSGISPAPASPIGPLPLLLIPLDKVTHLRPLKIAQIRHASGFAAPSIRTQAFIDLIHWRDRF